MRELLLGIDAGNYWAKTAGIYGVDKFRTSICDWFQRDFKERFGEDDMEFKIDCKKGFAGSIAEVEDVFGGIGMYGESKAHSDTKIRVLLALYRYIERFSPGTQTVKIVIGQPISSHNDSEKQKLKDMLIGTHDITVNHKQRVIHIKEVGVSGEGCGAYWSNPLPGKIRIIDIGSGTVNMATIFQKKVINNDSATLNFGIETVERGMDAIASGIIRSATKLRWVPTDQVKVCGGAANEVLPFIKVHFPEAQVLQTFLKREDGYELVPAVYANAVGNYELARLTYT